MADNPEYVEALLREAFTPWPEYSITWLGDEPVFIVEKDDEDTGLRIEDRGRYFEVEQVGEDGIHRPFGTFYYPGQVARAITEDLR